MPYFLLIQVLFNADMIIGFTSFGVLSGLDLRSQQSGFIEAYALDRSRRKTELVILLSHRRHVVLATGSLHRQQSSHSVVRTPNVVFKTLFDMVRLVVIPSSVSYPVTTIITPTINSVLYRL